MHGHGTPDEGAQSSNGTTEAEINLKIAFKVQNLLEQSGATVILTRSDESAIYDLDKKTLREKKISDINNRVAMKLENVYIIKKVEIPISIVECGFLSNKEEEAQLLTDEYQNKLAWGIYLGIMDYFNN